jgi:phosphatidylglycerophosphatase A
MSAPIATLFGIGHLRPAPGTWGSLATLPLFWATYQLLGFAGVIVFTAAIFFVGWWVTENYIRATASHDPSEVVIDEMAGQWIALLPLAFAMSFSNAHSGALWPEWVAAFVLFRLFDITKLGPIGWADRRNDALGVMLDDCIAGIFAGTGVIIMTAIW